MRMLFMQCCFAGVDCFILSGFSLLQRLQQAAGANPKLTAERG